jgi:hypothetical protein
MPLGIGTALALVVGLYATAIRLDRDRCFYTVVTMLVATYYVLFAVIRSPVHTLVIESLVCAVFWAAAAVGFRRTPWLVAATLALHGAFDLVHDAVISNPGMPAWWPQFCMAYDFAAAAYLAWLLRNRRERIPS